MPRSRDRNGRLSQLPATPLPHRKLFILGLMLALNNCSIWMILSFLPFITAHFNPASSVAELAYRAGYLGAAFSCGSIVGNILWGITADKYGRRKAILSSLLGTTIASLLFGFSPTFSVAVILRCLWGLFDANIGVAKTYIGEILDDSNTARGMALFGVIGGLGRFIGPLIGGYLSFPVDNYSSLKGTIFASFPIALPAAIISVDSLVVLIFAYFGLSETLKLILKKSRVDQNKKNYTGKKKKVLKRGSAEYGEVSVRDYENDIDSYDDIPSPTKAKITKSGGLFSSLSSSFSSSSTLERRSMKSITSSSQSHLDSTLPLLSLRMPSSDMDSRTSSGPTSARIEASLPDHFRNNSKLSHGPFENLEICNYDSGMNNRLDRCRSDDQLITPELSPVGSKAGQKINFEHDVSNEDEKGEYSPSGCYVSKPFSVDNSTLYNCIESLRCVESTHSSKEMEFSLPNMAKNIDGCNKRTVMGKINDDSECEKERKNGEWDEDRNQNNGAEKEKEKEKERDTLSATQPSSRRVSFSSLVMFKVIGSTSLGIGQLKHVRSDDLPVDDSVPPLSSFSVDLETGSGNDMQNLNQNICNSPDMRNQNMQATYRMSRTRYSNGSEFNKSLAARNGSLTQRVKYLFSKRTVCVSTLMYGCTGLVQLMFSETFSVWLIASEDEGGFGFEIDSSFSAIMVSAIFTVFLQLFMYPILVDMHGIVRTYRTGCNLFAASVFSLPLISFLKSHTVSQGSLWVLIVISLTVMGTAMMFTLISVFILINNSCYSHERATVNGIGQVLVSFGRLCGPFLVASAISITSHNGRTDWAYNYFILGAISLLNSRLALLLPRSIERRKREPREPRYASENNDRETDFDDDDFYDEGRSEMEELISEEDSSFEESGPYSTQPSGSLSISCNHSQSHSKSTSLSSPINIQNDKSKIHSTATIPGLGSRSGDDEFESDSLGNVTSRSL